MTHDVGTPHGTILHFKHPAQKGVQPLPPLKRSNNLDFQSLIELYVDHFDQIGTRGRQCRRLVAVKILNHDTFDHRDLILKFSILEIELGLHKPMAQGQGKEDYLLCLLFRKSLLTIIESNLRITPA